MNFIITYCKDTKAFIEELEKVAPDYVTVDENGKKGWMVQTTPIVKSENGTLAMSILTDEELMFMSSLKEIKSLGTYEELFADEVNNSLYKSVYPYDVPLSYEDENGNIAKYYRPKKIGDFAL